ncbi:hypothetical protein JCM8547_007063 [Rhodosporidiobolus lusitaniae]
MPTSAKEIKSAVASLSTSRLPLDVLISQGMLVKQGAEARVYKTTLYPSPSLTASSSSSSSSSSPSSSSAPPAPLPPPPVPILLKHRFPKAYRHPSLDAVLTRQRIQSEARALVRCQRAGVTVPGLRVVDVGSGALGLEWVEGWSVREVLGGGQEEDDLPPVGEEEEEATAETGEGEDGEEEEDIGEMLKRRGVDEDRLLHLIGLSLARMHCADIIHGDLTTSNMMVRLLTDKQRRAGGGSESEMFEVVLIDFGLSTTSPMSEDRAVDLYVLERAFSSTHPVSPNSTPHFDRVLKGYEEGVREKEGERKVKGGTWEATRERLEEVRGRGRKRSMVG